MKFVSVIRWGFVTIMMLIATVGCTPFSDDERESAQTQANLQVPKAEALSKTGNNPYVVDGILYTPLSELNNFTQTGSASWYGKKFHGKKTSSGEVYDMYQFSAAHKTLPIPSYINVTNLVNNKSLIVRVNDRGPFVGPRILDLSYAAAKHLGFVSQGTTRIKIESISKITRDDHALSSAGEVYLQTGVYSQQENALQAKTRLESEGYRVKVDHSDGTLYKVKVGPFSTAVTAFNEKSGLEKILHQPVMLVTEQ